MSDELKPCPFCGNEAEISIDNKCSCSQYLHAFRIEEWNTRPIEDELQRKLDIAVEALKWAHKDMMNMKNHPEIDWSFHYHTLDNGIILPALKKLEE